MRLGEEGGNFSYTRSIPVMPCDAPKIDSGLVSLLTLRGGGNMEGMVP